MNFPIPSESLSLTRRSELLQEAGLARLAEKLSNPAYRPEGIILEPLTQEESDAVELDRR